MVVLVVRERPMPSDTAPPPSAPPPLPHIYVLNADLSFLTLMGDLLQQKGVHVTLEQLQPPCRRHPRHPAGRVSHLAFRHAQPTRPGPAPPPPRRPAHVHPPHLAVCHHSP